MMLMKTIILSALYASVTCFELKNSNLSPTNPPITHTNMAQLFELCFTNTSNPIAITENLVKTFHKNLPITIKAPVIIINEKFIAKDIQLYYPTYPMYILSVSSYVKLFMLLRKLISSPLWSQKSIFFVIFETENPCERSYEILDVLWRISQLLSSIVVCSRTGNETSLYTYNPFTNRAPDPWVAINISWLDWRDQPLTLYNQSFSNDYKICETLFYDKTKTLNGYPVKMVSDNKIKYYLFDIIFTSLNMTQRATYFEFKNVSSGLASIINGTFDISTFGIQPVGGPRYIHTVPVAYEISYIIVTQKASFLSASYEIAHVFDINGAISIIFLLLLITLLIVLHNKYQIGLAVLDVLKLLMSMGIDAPLDRLAMKITFFTGFLFVFMFSPLLEGQIFAILTRPPTYNIESLKDLYNHKYHVYFPQGIKQYILEENLWKTVEDMKYLHPKGEFHAGIECLKQVSENNMVACIFQDGAMRNYAVQHNFHISKRFMLKRSSFHHAHKFWVLSDRFYHKSLSIHESGFYIGSEKRILEKSHRKIKAKERREKIVDYQIIDAVDLTYLYVFMAFFQFLAVIVFGIEYIVGRHRRPIQ